jgi:hypothetical protein
VVAVQQVGRDAEEPGPRVGPRQVVPGPFVEGDQKGLGRQLISKIPADPPLQIAMHGIEMPIEDRRKASRSRSRRQDRIAVRG